MADSFVAPRSKMCRASQKHMSIRNARDEILAFWFENAPDMNKWFMKSRDFDAYIRTHFSSTLERGEELVDWADTPSGFVALIVLLDQFSRQIWRGSPKAFAYDALALREAARVRVVALASRRAAGGGGERVGEGRGRAKTRRRAARSARSSRR